MDLKAESWRRCSSCKSEIAYAQTYWVCNVSTCNRKRTGLAFCSVSCWDAHLPVMRHREAWARERTAPTRSQAQREGAEGSEQRGPGKAGDAARSTPSRAPRRTLVRERPSDSGGGPPGSREILIVASRLKAYVRARSGMNTSEGVMERLSDHVRALVDEAIKAARRAERKTVMDRDFRDR